MSDILDFPASLHPIISQGFLDREFAQALRTNNRYRACADRVDDLHVEIGQTIKQTRGGITPGSTEEYTIAANVYAATTDLNVVTERVGIASQFLQNAYVNGEQAGRSLDELAQNALFKAYVANPLRFRGSLKMGSLLDAVATLRDNGALEIDGTYNCYLDPVSSRQLFSDPDFKQLFQGATSANRIFSSGMTSDFLGLRFIPVREEFPQVVSRRVAICGKGALVEGAIASMCAADIAPKDALVKSVDGVAMVTRHIVDRLQSIIAQSWYWIGGFGAVADITAGEPVYKRAVILEHVG